MVKKNSSNRKKISSKSKDRHKKLHNHALFYMAFILISFTFIYAFLNNSSTNLTGYIVLEPGIKISTEKLDSALIQELNSGEDQPRVVVILKDNAQTLSDNLDIKTEAIAEVQQEIIKQLDQDLEITDKNIELSNSTTDLTLTQQFDSVNALALEIKDTSALVELTEDSNIKKIILDYPVSSTLDESVPQINAKNLFFGNISLDGSGETVCIIDTGIDYTHSALGSCNPVLTPNFGEIESLTNPLESAHPYSNNFDYTWNITKSGYDNIAVHFVNLSLESLNGGDSLDRVYVYDSEHNLLAVYKENLHDFWSPVSRGNTIYIRLVSDPSIRNYGFFIDTVKNGSTNTTLDWSSCSTIIGGWDVYNNDPDPKDDHGHGTHVAGIIASTNETYRGVSPKAKLVAVKALSNSGSGYASDVLAGIDWCTRQSKILNISTISMSLGCDGSSCTHYQTTCVDDLLSPVILQAQEKNISVFIAAGNSGWSDGISNPACAPGAIPVGGVDYNDNVRFNRGNLLKLLAPSLGITSSTLGNSWVSWSGTSMATPHAAGAAALLREYWRLAYNLTPTPQQIENKLALSGKLISDPSSGLNFSRIDLAGALKPILENELKVRNNNVSLNLSSDVPLAQAVLILNSNNSTLIKNYSLIRDSDLLFSLELNNLTNGNYAYTILGQESGGQWEESEEINFIINVSSEELTNVTENNTVENESFWVNFELISPLKDYLNSNFNLSFMVNGSGLDHLDYSLGTISEMINLTGLNYTIIEREINVSSLAEGDLNFSSSINDNLSLEHHFVLDRVLPTLLLMNSNFDNLTSLLNITISIEELNLNHSLIYFSTNYSGTWINQSMQDLENNSFTSSLNINSTIFYRFSAEDLAGNLFSSQFYNFTINIINPTINSTNTTNSTNLNNVTNSTITNITGTTSSTAATASSGASGGSGGGGSSGTTEYSNLGSTDAPTDAPTVAATSEAQTLNAANIENNLQPENPASEQALNLTAKISESNLKKYAPALYVLSGLFVLLLAIYVFFLWKKQD